MATTCSSDCIPRRWPSTLLALGILTALACVDQEASGSFKSEAVDQIMEAQERGEPRPWLPAGVALSSDDAKAMLAENPDKLPQTDFEVQLVELIDRSDRIVILEHAGPGSGTQNALPGEPAGVRVYKHLSLEGDDIAAFKAQMIKMGPTFIPAPVTACMFNPHHRLQFYSGDEQTGWADVCFECWQAQWSGGGGTPIPQAFFEVLGLYLSDKGFRPYGDWLEIYRLEREKAAEGDGQKAH